MVLWSGLVAAARSRGRPRRSWPAAAECRPPRAPRLDGGRRAGLRCAAVPDAPQLAARRCRSSSAVARRRGRAGGSRPADVAPDRPDGRAPRSRRCSSFSSRWRSPTSSSSAPRGQLPNVYFPPGVIQNQQDYLLGSANQLLGGGALLVNVPVSQYGVGLIYFLDGWFHLVPIGYGTLGLLDSILTALFYVGGYGVLRVAGTGRLLAVGGAGRRRAGTDLRPALPGRRAARDRARCASACPWRSCCSTGAARAGRACARLGARGGTRRARRRLGLGLRGLRLHAALVLRRRGGAGLAAPPGAGGAGWFARRRARRAAPASIAHVAARRGHAACQRSPARLGPVPDLHPLVPARRRGRRDHLRLRATGPPDWPSPPGRSPRPPRSCSCSRRAPRSLARRERSR